MKFGIIGAAGYWGTKWVRVLQNLGVLNVVCDLSKDRLNSKFNLKHLKNQNIKVCYSTTELINQKIDGIFIVTPPNTHTEIAIQGIRSGKHVFVEKPLAERTEDCFRIKWEAERHNRHVMVGHTFIYHPSIIKFKKILKKHKIGKVRTIYTIRTDFGLHQKSGIVHDLLPHDISIFSYLCEDHPDTIRAEVNPHQDVAYITAEYKNIYCSAFLSWSFPDKTRKLMAVGDKGILEADQNWSHILLHKKWTTSQDDNCHKHFDEGIRTISVKNQSEPLMNEALHFIDCIKNNKPPLTGIDDGIKIAQALEICNAR